MTPSDSATYVKGWASIHDLRASASEMSGEYAHVSPERKTGSMICQTAGQSRASNLRMVIIKMSKCEKFQQPPCVNPSPQPSPSRTGRGRKLIDRRSTDSMFDIVPRILSSDLLLAAEREEPKAAFFCSESTPKTQNEKENRESRQTAGNERLTRNSHDEG